MAREYDMAKKSLQKTSDTWFLNSCVSRHLCNNRELFRNTQFKNINFVNTVGQIIQTNEIGNVRISLSSKKIIDLHNVAFAPVCNSNLISLSQLHESGTTLYDKLTKMMLIRKRNIIVYARQDCNLFLFDFARPGVAMSIKKLKPKAMAISG